MGGDGCVCVLVGGWRKAQVSIEETHTAGTCEEPGTMVQARQMVED